MPNNKKIREMDPKEKAELIGKMREGIAFKAELIRGMCMEAWRYQHNAEALEIISIYGAGFNALHAAKAVEWFPNWFDDSILPTLRAKYEDYLCLLAIASCPKEEALQWYAKFESKRKKNLDWTPWEIYIDIQVAKGKRERHDPAALKFDGRVTFRKNIVLVKPKTSTGAVIRDNGDYHVKLIKKEKE